MRQTTLITLFLIITSSLLTAQTFAPIGFDINSPLGVEVDDKGYVWLVEGGTGSDDGQIWRFHPDGSGEVIVTDLPSFFNVASQELQGPLDIVIENSGILYVVQGGGPSDISGSIISFDLESYKTKGEALTPADAHEIVNISSWVLENGFAESNPYSMVLQEDGNMLISDAAANAVIKYEASTEELAILTMLPPAPNPLPFGPPFIDAVPTKIMKHPDGGYLLSQLTGFPFLKGAASIYHVLEDGSSSVYASGLTLTTDMAIDPQDGNLVALQFANFGPMGFEFASAQLVKIHKDKSQQILAAGFGPSSGIGMAPNGDIYASHLFLGQLLALPRCDVTAGTISTPTGRTSFTACISDGVPDRFDINSSDSKGETSLIITDGAGIIIDIVENSAIDLAGADEGICTIYQVAYDPTIRGLHVGASIDALTGCYDISNGITVQKIHCEGCHIPLNFRYTQRSSNVFQLKWDRVSEARSYEMTIGYKGQNGSFINIPVRRNNVVLSIPEGKMVEVSVRAICGLGSISDDTQIIDLNTNTQRSGEARSAIKGKRYGDFIIESHDIDISPNPATEFISLQLSLENESSIFELHSIDGRKMLSQRLQNYKSNHVINISDIRDGLYIGTLISNGEILAQRRVVIVR